MRQQGRFEIEDGGDRTEVGGEIVDKPIVGKVPVKKMIVDRATINRAIDDRATARVAPTILGWGFLCCVIVVLPNVPDDAFDKAVAIRDGDQLPGEQFSL